MKLFALVGWLAILLVLAFGGLAAAEGVHVGKGGVVFWNQNSEIDLLGYKVYIGTSPGVYNTITDVGLTPTPASPLERLDQFGLVDGQHYVCVSAYDDIFNDSGCSVEIPFVLDTAGPLVPTGVGVRIKL